MDFAPLLAGSGLIGLLLTASYFLKIPKWNSILGKWHMLVPIVGIVLMLSALGIVSSSMLSFAAVAPAATTPGATPTYMNLCPTGATSGWYARGLDSEATTTTYLPTPVFITDDANTFSQGAPGGLTGYLAGTAIPCGRKDVKIWALSNSSTVGVVSPISASVIDQEPKYYSFDDANRTSTLKFRVKSVKTDAYWYSRIADTGTAAGSASTGWTLSNDPQFNETDARVTVDTDTNGYQELDIFVSANETNHVFGMKGGQCIVAVEAEAGQWLEPDYLLWDGVQMQEIKGTLSKNTETMLSGYEYIYQIPVSSGYCIDDSIHKLSVKVKSASGVDPGAANDLKFRFLMKGNFLSEQTPGKVLTDYATDAGTPAIFGYQPASVTTAFSGDELTIDEVA